MKKEKEEKVEETIDKQSEEAVNDPAGEARLAEDQQEEKDSSESIKADLEEAKDKYLRLYSEFENFRRRTSKEKLELIGTASRELMESLLPVLDDFERSLTQEKEEGDSEGVRLIYNKLINILTAKGLKKMEIKSGDDFNDEYHEAITQIPAPNKKLAGKIVDVVEPGYYLNDKVIRFAKVVTGAKE